MLIVLGQKSEREALTSISLKLIRRGADSRKSAFLPA
jgi:hypothetical protein